MSTIITGSPTTSEVKEGSIGAKTALLVPSTESDAAPSAALLAIPGVIVTRLKTSTKMYQFWDAGASSWVNIGVDPQNITSFYVGQPTYPADGATFYTNSNFAGKQLTIDTTIQGTLIYGKHYRRYDGNTTTENVTGDTIKPIAPISFQEGDSWRFIGGLAITGSDEILAAAEAYTDAAVADVAAGVQNAFATTNPSTYPTISAFRAASGATTYTNFLSAASTPIVVSSVDLGISGGIESNEVFFYKKPDGFWEKKIKKLADTSQFTARTIFDPVQKVTKNNKVFAADATGVLVDSLNAFFLNMRVLTANTMVGTKEYYLFNWGAGDVSGYKLEIKDSTNTYVIFANNIAVTPPSDWTRRNHTFTVSNGGNVIELTVNWDNYLPLIFTGSSFAAYKLNNNLLFNQKTLAEVSSTADTALSNSAGTFSKAKLSVYQSNVFPLNTTFLFRDIFEKFFVSIKMLLGFDSAKTYRIEALSKVSDTITLSLVSSVANDRPAFNFVITKSTGIQTYIVERAGYKTAITVNHGYFDEVVNVTGANSNAAVFDNNSLVADDLFSIKRGLQATRVITQLVTDGQSKVAPVFTTAESNITISKVADGTRIQITAAISTDERKRLSFKIPFARPNRRYAVYAKVRFDIINTTPSSPTQTFLNTSVSRSGVGINFPDNVKTWLPGVTYEYAQFGTTPSGMENTDQSSNFFDVWKRGAGSGVVIDLVVSDFRFYDLGSSTDFLDMTEWDFIQLIHTTGYVEGQVNITKYAIASPRKTDLLTDKKMESYGDSVTGMSLWQPHIAQAKGFIWNQARNQFGTDGYAPTGLGGSHLEPIIIESVPPKNAGNNIYSRLKSSAVFYAPDILFLLASFNGAHAFRPGETAYNNQYARWVVGGQYTKEDHGINDAPYTGGEVDLIANPAADFPSFGASYYGVLEWLMAALPKTRIILLTLFDADPQAGHKNNVAKKNAVIKRAGEKYNLQVIDLFTKCGINDITRAALCFNNGVHPNELGGQRFASVVIGEV